MFHIDKVHSGFFYPYPLFRGGIIPYITEDDKVLYALGLDSTSADLTDFGGRRDMDEDPDIIDTAIREFHEETLGVFGPINREDLIGSTIIYDSQSAIIFYKYNIRSTEINNLTQDFYKQQSKSQKSEISTIVWLTEDQIKEAIRLNRYVVNGFQPFIIYYPTLRLLNAYFQSDNDVSI